MVFATRFAGGRGGRNAFVHYPSDVATGAVLGALCGWTVRRVTGSVTGHVTGKEPR